MAGVAKISITPQQPMWMSGYASRTKPADGTLHEIWAKALVLQDPHGHQLVLVSLDLVGIGSEISRQICDDLQKLHSLKRSQIALCTSHTHTGPVVGHNLGSMYFLDESNQKLVNEYSTFLINSVKQVVASAMESKEAASISYGLGQATFAVNRRNNREADVPQLREAGELKGPIDHSVPVLAVRNAAHELKSVVFGYACHATVLSLNQWSGDWPGFAQIEIEKQHPGVVALFMAGCGADQNPLPRRTVELAENYGQQMCAAVNAVLSSEMKVIVGQLKSEYQEIDVSLATLPTKVEIETDLKSDNKYIASRASHLLKKLETDGRLDSTYPYPIQAWALGSSAQLVLLGGEVVVDYSLRLKEENSSRDLWVAGYSNDVMAYIPSERVLKEGGYEGATSMIYYGLPTVWAAGLEDQISSTVSSLLKTVE